MQSSKITNINLIVTLDKNYLQPLDVMLQSYGALHKDIKTDLYVVHSSLTEGDFHPLESTAENFNIQIHNIKITDKFFKDTPILARIPEESFYRLLAFKYLPESVDRCLYLDPDIYFLKSIMPLYEIDFNGSYIAAAAHLHGFHDAFNKMRLGLKNQKRYLNSGVVLMNLEAIRRDFDLEKVLECLEKNVRRLILGDQDLMNILFGNHTLLVDERIYNLNEWTYKYYKKHEKLDITAVEKGTSIVHYSGKYKPWLEDYKGELDRFYPPVSNKGAAPKGMIIKQIKSVLHITKPTKPHARENGQLSTEIEQTAAAPHCVLEIEKESLHLLDIVQETNEEMKAYYPKMLEDDYSDEETDAKVSSLKRANTNITKVLVHTASIRDELSARQNDIKKQKKKRKFISTAPSNASIDLSENESKHFAKGLNIYKILLICFIGSFVGVVVELLWCLLTNGYLESRSGLVYGPFNLLYGAGAVALSLCLYKFRNRGSWLSFFGGMVVGSVVEYICSWGQEVLFGSRSWDYSHMPFNINGRICLLYSVFWGFLGVLWIKNIYPRMAKAILKIPNRIGKMITWILVIFFVFNGFMSAVSMFRWSQRTTGIEPSNSFWELIDERFPDERMRRIYANMEFSNDR